MQEERLQVADNNWHREAGGRGYRSQTTSQLAQRGRRRGYRSQTTTPPAERGRRRGYRSLTTTGIERQEERLQVS